jgi:hypothetical protein
MSNQHDLLNPQNATFRLAVVGCCELAFAFDVAVQCKPVAQVRHATVRREDMGSKDNPLDVFRVTIDGLRDTIFSARGNARFGTSKIDDTRRAIIQHYSDRGFQVEYIS